MRATATEARLTADDLGPKLEGARRTRRGWTARCPAHADRRPSLDIAQDGDKVLVVCRAGCRQDEVLAALRRRGLWQSGVRPAAPPRPASPLQAARRQILREARREAWAQDGVRERWAIADCLREAERAVMRAREVATAAGPTEEVWALLARVADLETHVFALDCAV